MKAAREPEALRMGRAARSAQVSRYSVAVAENASMGESSLAGVGSVGSLTDGVELATGSLSFAAGASPSVEEAVAGLSPLIVIIGGPLVPPADEAAGAPLPTP